MSLLCPMPAIMNPFVGQKGIINAKVFILIQDSTLIFVRQKDLGAMTFMEMEGRRSAAATRHCKNLVEI